MASGPPPVAVPAAGFERGTAGYRRAGAAMCAAGAGTFTLLYATQALLPALSDEFVVSPAQASLALSLATGALAVCLIPAGALAGRLGAARLMRTSLAAATALGMLVPLAPTFEVLLVIRTAQGAVMAGVPALAMAHLGRVIHPRDAGGAVGLLVAGNTLGGLSGRVVSSAVADVAGWRGGMAAVGLLALVCLTAFWRLLPPPPPGPRAPGPAGARPHVRCHLRDPGLLRLFGIAFLLMSAFVTVFNYLAFRLSDQPFALSQTAVGSLFLAHLAGTVACTVAGWAGDRSSRRRVLTAGVLLAQAALLLTLVEHLGAVLVGLVLFTAGFFAAHTAAGGWVGDRAVRGREQASSLYLLAYYAGSSIGGTAGGLVFASAGWAGLVILVSGLLLTALTLGCLRGRDTPT